MRARLMLITACLALSAPAWAEPPAPGQLFRRGEFAGKKLLIANYYDPPEIPLEFVPPILRQMGFDVRIANSPPSLPSLADVDQLWIISGPGDGKMAQGDLAAIRKFVDAGKGLYVLADNTPFTHEANLIGGALNDVHVEGEYTGMKMVTVMSRRQIQALLKEATDKQDSERLAAYRRAGYFNGNFYAEDHELLTGIAQIYEGGTICHPTSTAGFRVILSSSINEPLVFEPSGGQQRVLYDCGWTRLYHEWAAHADTSTRWYQNVAAYLMGKRRSDLPVD